MRTWLGYAFVFFAIAMGFLSCKRDVVLEENGSETIDLEVPSHFPDLPDLSATPLTESKVLLGKLLFHDVRLSVDGSVSCASCHLQDKAFADTTALSFGVGMAEGMRNAPSLANVVYQPRLFADGGVPSLELQVLAPIGDPLEMAHNILTVSDQLSADPFLNELSQEVFERDIDPFVITRSIAAFERTILSTQSKYDEYLQGSTILNEDELAGMELFNSDELQCSSCHQGALFTDFDYYNIGLYEEYEDSGRERISLDENDNGKFKTPSLRNIALTPPYMHHGSIETLEEVIDFFAAGGLDHPNKDGRVNGFELSEDEKMQLIAFLKTLSDPQLLTNPDF